MIPARFAPLLFSFILSGLMSFIVSGIAIMRANGINAALPAEWIAGWLPSWCVAFPTVFVLAPMVRRVVGRLTA